MEYLVNLTKDYSMVHDQFLVTGQDLELPTVNKTPGSSDHHKKLIKS